MKVLCWLGIHSWRARAPVSEWFADYSVRLCARCGKSENRLRCGCLGTSRYDCRLFRHG